MQTLFRSLVALVLAAAVWGCGIAPTRENDRYCESNDWCAMEKYCALPAKQCREGVRTDGGGGVPSDMISSSPDMAGSTSSPDMTGTPGCSFERQDVCQEGVHCLPRPGQGEDNTTECRLEKAVVKATSSVVGANNVSIECSDGAGTLNVIKPKVGEWVICPAPTNKAAKALGNDRLYVAVAGSGQIKSYPAGTSVPLL